ncbi:MAG: hypothetical protein JST35_05385 [Armatimonadetes bacterium]|nr:hypothetical protein [Armatimonadota bacterium]
MSASLVLGCTALIVRSKIAPIDVKELINISDAVVFVERGKTEFAPKLRSVIFSKVNPAPRESTFEIQPAPQVFAGQPSEMSFCGVDSSGFLFLKRLKNRKGYWALSSYSHGWIPLINEQVGFREWKEFNLDQQVLQDKLWIGSGVLFSTRLRPPKGKLISRAAIKQELLRVYRHYARPTTSKK